MQHVLDLLSHLLGGGVETSAALTLSLLLPHSLSSLLPVRQLEGSTFIVVPICLELPPTKLYKKKTHQKKTPPNLLKGFVCQKSLSLFSSNGGREGWWDRERGWTEKE